MTIAQRIAAATAKVNADAERKSWTRAIAAKVLTAKNKQDPAKIIKDNWPGDERAQLIVSRGAVSPTTSAGLWTYDPTAEFRSIAPNSAALALFQMGLALDLTGATTIHIPRAPLDVLPIFVGEGQPGPVVKRNLKPTILGPVKKILLLATVTGELNDCTPGTASAVIGKILSDAVQRSIDVKAFSADDPDDDNPAGLLNKVTAITAAAAGPDAMAQDLAALSDAIGVKGINTSNVVYVAGPREVTIMKATLGPRFDYQILTTLGLPAKSVACFAPAGVASGYQEPPTIEASKEAVLHHEDTDPLDISSGTGVAAPSKGVFQTNLIAIRVRGNCAWAVADGAAQVITAVNW